MGRLVLAGTLVAITVGIASAGPTRKVSIETEPAGATVYLDDVDKGPVCDKTPCTFDAPLGKRIVILRLDKYEPDFVEVDVTKGKKPLSPPKQKLKSAMGTIVVDGPKGASVRIDEEDQGKAPVEVQVSSADGHHVVVTLNRKTLYDDYVEVATGESVPIKTSVAAKGGDGDDGDDGDGDDSGGGDGDGDGSQAITGKGEAGPREQFLSAGVAVDVGFRTFTYDNAVTGNLRRESEIGQTIAGPVVEFFPGRMLRIGPLRGLSLFARMQFNVYGQTVTGEGLAGQVKTTWSSLEASVRQRWTFSSIGVEVGAGYVKDSFGFKANAADLMLMPDAQYSSIRIGGKLMYVSDSAEPYVAVENRIVLSGGALEERFRTAEASGLRGALGLNLKLTPALYARAEAVLMSYSWTFSFEPGDEFRAQGATDSVKLLSFNAGYSY